MFHRHKPEKLQEDLIFWVEHEAAAFEKKEQMKSRVLLICFSAAGLRGRYMRLI